MSANGAEYGMPTMHYYWIGPVPTMLFLGIVAALLPLTLIGLHRVGGVGGLIDRVRTAVGAARSTPIIASFPKMFIPFIVVIPGMIAGVLVPEVVQLKAGDQSAGTVLIIMGLVMDSAADRAKTGDVNANLWAGIGMAAVAAAFAISVRLRPVIIESPAQPVEAVGPPR